MHNNQYHRVVAAHGAGSRGSSASSSSSSSSRRGGAGSSGERRLGALEAVVLGIIFIVGVSFGMYIEGRQHHDELQSFTSPKSMALLKQQDAGRGCDLAVKRAVDERDETCKKLMEKLQAECSVAAQKADPKRDTAAAVAPSAEDDAGCSVKEAEVGRRLQVLQEATGYHVLASLEIDPVLDAFLSHMVPFEREELKRKALLVGNDVEKRGNERVVAEAIPFEDSLKCKSLSLVMTGSDRGTCTLLVPMDRSTTSFTVYRHERFASDSLGLESEGEDKGKQEWRPVGKAPKETRMLVTDHHRVPAERALLRLLQHLPEIEDQVGTILKEMVGLASKAREEGRHVKVMILNAGNAAMFLNMMCSAQRQGLDFRNDLLIFAADAGVDATLTKLGYRTYRHAGLGDFGPDQHMAYGDNKFINMMWLKTVSGWLVNRLNYDMLYLDADLIYRKNTDELFENPEVDIFMQDDGARSERFGPYFGNTGFFFLRANWRTKHLMQMMLYNHELVLAWRSHQAVFTYLMEDVYLRNLLNVKIIPLDLLPSGKIYHHRKSIMKELVDGQREFYMFHMNWALNNKDKVKYLKELGWWYIADRCNTGKDALPASIGAVKDCCVEPDPVEWPPKVDDKAKSSW